MKKLILCNLLGQKRFILCRREFLQYYDGTSTPLLEELPALSTGCCRSMFQKLIMHVIEGISFIITIDDVTGCHHSKAGNTSKSGADVFITELKKSSKMEDETYLTNKINICNA